MRQNETILGDCREVAVLFARADSVYKELSGTDVWDIRRDATRWPGGSQWSPIHPAELGDA